MRKKMTGSSFVCRVGISIFCGGVLAGGVYPVQGEEVFVLESKVDLDQFSPSGEGLDGGVRISDEVKGLEIKQDQLIQMSRSLRHVLEENERLRTENEDMGAQLRTLRGQRNIEEMRADSVMEERDVYQKQAEQVLVLNEQIQKNLEELREHALKEREDWQKKVAALEKFSEEQGQKREEEKKQFFALPAGEEKLVVDTGNEDVVRMIQLLDQESKRMNVDEAKVHYNMGNIFFNQGKYEQAVGEYREAVRLVTDDASAHFNLAFVSDEYMHDYDTALKHYKKYLELNENADDVEMVKEKIFSLEVLIGSRIDSPLEKDWAAFDEEMKSKQTSR
ncbi:MAG: tetratricopeptide repeat protein [Candidatus Omnitrophica bacterium]|nr:tetratricopeptide repeat protein [Candidatus Omnitrophota bacterium]